MTTPDIAKLRRHLADAADGSTHDIAAILNALPALCDAAEENVRLRSELVTLAQAQSDVIALRAQLAAEREAVKVLLREAAELCRRSLADGKNYPLRGYSVKEFAAALAARRGDAP